MSSNQTPPNPADSIPTFRDGSAYDIGKALSDAMLARRGDLLKSCMTCIEFTEASEFCRKWGGRPPARIIAYGCHAYAHTDEIPF